MKRKTVNQLIGIVLAVIQIAVVSPVIIIGFVWFMAKAGLEMGESLFEELQDITEDKLKGK